MRMVLWNSKFRKNLLILKKETFPFISNENEIYFASDGHPGLGGLDVFNV
jgi:hypothetical protein